MCRTEVLTGDLLEAEAAKAEKAEEADEEKKLEAAEAIPGEPAEGGEAGAAAGGGAADTASQAGAAEGAEAAAGEEAESEAGAGAGQADGEGDEPAEAEAGEQQEAAADNAAMPVGLLLMPGVCEPSCGWQLRKGFAKQLAWLMMTVKLTRVLVVLLLQTPERPPPLRLQRQRRLLMRHHCRRQLPQLTRPPQSVAVVQIPCWQRHNLQQRCPPPLRSRAQVCQIACLLCPWLQSVRLQSTLICEARSQRVACLFRANTHIVLCGTQRWMPV